MLPLRTLDFARREAITADLRALAALGVVATSIPDEARRYASHLRALADEDPLRLLAHAWVRYLGDLSGGVIVGRIVGQSLALPSDAMQFYAFPSIADPRVAASEWRTALDAARLDADAQQGIIEEAVDGFRRHIALFRALASPGSVDPDTQDAADSSSAA